MLRRAPECGKVYRVDTQPDLTEWVQILGLLVAWLLLVSAETVLGEQDREALDLLTPPLYWPLCSEAYGGRKSWRVGPAGPSFCGTAW